MNTAGKTDSFYKIGSKASRYYKKDTTVQSYTFDKVTDANATLAGFSDADKLLESKYTNGFPVDKATVRFNVAADENLLDGKYYSISDATTFTNKTYYQVEMYKTNNDSAFADVVLITDSAKYKPIYTSYPCMIEAANICISGVDDSVTTGLNVHYAAELSYVTDIAVAGDEVEIELVSGQIVTVPGDDVGKYIGAGDVVQIGDSQFEMFYHIKQLFDYSERKSAWGYENYKYDSISYSELQANDNLSRFIYGFVYDKYMDSSFSDRYTNSSLRTNIILTIGDIKSNEERDMMTFYMPWVVMYDSQSRGHKVYAASPGEIISYKDSGEKMEAVIINTTKYNKYVFMYK